MRRTTSARRRWGIDYDYIIVSPGGMGGRGEGEWGWGEGGRTDVRWEVTRLNAGDFKTFASILLKNGATFQLSKKNSFRYIYKKLIDLSIKWEKKETRWPTLFFGLFCFFTKC
jgi:hypothetical protein